MVEPVSAETVIMDIAAQQMNGKNGELAAKTGITWAVEGTNLVATVSGNAKKNLDAIGSPFDGDAKSATPQYPTIDAKIFGDITPQYVDGKITIPLSQVTAAAVQSYSAAADITGKALKEGPGYAEAYLKDPVMADKALAAANALNKSDTGLGKFSVTPDGNVAAVAGLTAQYNMMTMNNDGIEAAKNKTAPLYPNAANMVFGEGLTPNFNPQDGTVTFKTSDLTPAALETFAKAANTTKEILTKGPEAFEATLNTAKQAPERTAPDFNSDIPKADFSKTEGLTSTKPPAPAAEKPPAELNPQGTRGVEEQPAKTVAPRSDITPEKQATMLSSIENAIANATKFDLSSIKAMAEKFVSGTAVESHTASAPVVTANKDMGRGTGGMGGVG